MIVSAEISYYPLTGDFDKPVNKFLKELSGREVVIETGSMSTLISGEYDVVMSILSNSMKKLMDEYPSVFTIKISNSCSLAD